MTRYRAVLAGLAALGCHSMLDSSAPMPQFSVQVGGDVQTTFAGTLRLTIAGQKYVESGPSGQATERAVTGLVLAQPDAAQPQVFIGLLGEVRAGSYRVHVPGTALGALPEFYASYSDQQSADGSRRVYEITGGVLTITQVEPAILGHFVLETTRYFLHPKNIGPGTTMTPQAGSLSVSGSLTPSPR